jgi:hypothetical protein
MTKETEKILDDMIAECHRLGNNCLSFHMHPKTKEERMIPEQYKGIDVFVSYLAPIDNIYLMPEIEIKP